MTGSKADLARHANYLVAPSDLLPGTLELLILKALMGGARHGYGIVEHLRLASDDVLRVGESALYPALQRLLFNSWVKAEWGTPAAGNWPPNATSSIAWSVRSSEYWERHESRFMASPVNSAVRLGTRGATAQTTCHAS